MFNCTSKHFIIHALSRTAVLGSVAFLSPAQALPWYIDSGTMADNGLVVTGSFNIDDELFTNPAMLASDVTIDGFVFGSSDAVIQSTPGVGVIGIDWIDLDYNLLSLAFDTPLAPQGGTVTLDNVVSSFVPFSNPTPLYISGSVSASTSAVPAPLPAMGAGACLVWSRKIRRKISMARQSQ